MDDEYPVLDLLKVLVNKAERRGQLFVTDVEGEFQPLEPPVECLHGPHSLPQPVISYSSFDNFDDSLLSIDGLVYAVGPGLISMAVLIPPPRVITYDTQNCLITYTPFGKVPLGTWAFDADRWIYVTEDNELDLYVFYQDH